MNKFQPLDQVRSIVATALNRTAKVRKNFESFFIETMILIFVESSGKCKISKSFGRTQFSVLKNLI
ncbi:MAG: hypothetical protein K1W02_01670, partial [Muribaculaceae bacterium]